MYTSIKVFSSEALKEFHNIVKEESVSSAEYILDEVIYKGIKITFYTTGTVLFNGDISKIRDELEILVDRKMYVGIDEVGVGENIGPYVSCAVRFNNFENKMNVAMHGIKDSKKMSHNEIIAAAKVIKNNSIWDCKVMEPKTFNKNYKIISNMKALNAIAQNDLHNGFSKYEDHVTDQFVNSKKYFEYLETYNQEAFKDIFFTTKAEDKYMEVAAAAIIAKEQYNTWLINYLESHNISYTIKNKLSSNDIWTRIKNGSINIEERDSLIKDWSK